MKTGEAARAAHALDEALNDAINRLGSAPVIQEAASAYAAFERGLRVVGPLRIGNRFLYVPLLHPPQEVLQAFAGGMIALAQAGGAHVTTWRQAWVVEAYGCFATPGDAQAFAAAFPRQLPSLSRLAHTARRTLQLIDGRALVEDTTVGVELAFLSLAPATPPDTCPPELRWVVERGMSRMVPQGQPWVLYLQDLPKQPEPLLDGGVITAEVTLEPDQIPLLVDIPAASLKTEPSRLPPWEGLEHLLAAIGAGEPPTAPRGWLSVDQGNRGELNLCLHAPAASLTPARVQPPAATLQPSLRGWREPSFSPAEAIAATILAGELTRVLVGAHPSPPPLSPSQRSLSREKRT